MRSSPWPPPIRRRSAGVSFGRWRLYRSLALTEQRRTRRLKQTDCAASKRQTKSVGPQKLPKSEEPLKGRHRADEAPDVRADTARARRSGPRAHAIYLVDPYSNANGNESNEEPESGEGKERKKGDEEIKGRHDGLPKIREREDDSEQRSARRIRTCSVKLSGRLRRKGLPRCREADAASDDSLCAIDII